MKVAPQQIVIPLSLVAGIVAGLYLTSWIWPAILASLGVACYLLLLYFGNTPSRSLRLSGYHWVWVCLLGVSLGMMTMNLHRTDTLPRLPEGEVAARGTVRSQSISTTHTRLLVDVDAVSYPDGRTFFPQNLPVMLTTDEATFSEGDVIVFPAVITPVDSIPDPTPAMTASLLCKGVKYTARVADGLRIRKSGHIHTLSSRLSDVRERAEIFIEKSGLERHTVEFLITVLLADKDFLGADTRRAFSDAGVAHILALSGMHVAVIFSVVFLLLYPLALIGRYKLRYFLVLPVVWFYVIFTGALPSAVRAAVMLTFGVAGILLERQNSSLGALCWAAFFILVFSPYTIFDIGFQLSFLCVAALILFVDPLNGIDSRRHHRLHSAVAALLATLVATAASWALVAYYFGRVPLMFLPANILVLPFLPVYVGVSLLHFLIAAVAGSSPAILVNLLDGVHSWLTALVSSAADDSSSTLFVNIGLPTVILWVSALLLAAFSIHLYKGKALPIAAGVTFCTALVSIPYFRIPEESGILFSRSFPNVELTACTGGKRKPVVLPRGNISRADLLGHRVMCVDIPLPESGFELHGVDYLVISTGYRGSLVPLDSLCRRAGVRPVYIIHSMVRKDLERSMLREADSLSLRAISLRDCPRLMIPADFP